MGEEEIDVKSFIVEDQWDRNKLLDYISEEMTDHIMNTISPKINFDLQDVPWWIGSHSGLFSVKSAWELMRRKKQREDKDKHGDLIYAQAKGIGIATNIEAEARAIQAALSISAKKGFQNLVIETDSMSLMKMILKTWRIPWEIAEILKYIIREVQQQEVTIKHIYREGNQMADYLANFAIGQTTIQEYVNFAELPTIGKHIINIDKAQIPTIRIKTKQIQHHATALTKFLIIYISAQKLSSKSQGYNLAFRHGDQLGTKKDKEPGMELRIPDDYHHELHVPVENTLPPKQISGQLKRQRMIKKELENKDLPLSSECSCVNCSSRRKRGDR
ncbi:hypothetical protein RDI58_010946 [Solanum bulbocastanum]|uniref:RNase H type-1 domain-containing protein n=1 Tax=Solanum bulbocastanum TaxID=147425 RepID=A0AAN8TRI6_SOLBU